MRTCIHRTLAVILLLAIDLGCKKFDGGQPDETRGYDSYQDIPGVTQDEIIAIEELRRQGTAFVYGMHKSTEAFTREDGEIQGFSALFCHWLTQLFGIPFRPALYGFDDLIEGLATGEIDFTGELMATDERREMYLMTDAIAERTLKYFQLVNSSPLLEIAKQRPLRYALIKYSNMIDAVISKLKDGTFEIVLLNSIAQAYDKLKSGEIDAFLISSVAEANFEYYDDIVARDFFPLISKPVSMSTRNPK